MQARSPAIICTGKPRWISTGLSAKSTSSERSHEHNIGHSGRSATRTVPCEGQYTEEVVCPPFQFTVVCRRCGGYLDLYLCSASCGTCLDERCADRSPRHHHRAARTGGRAGAEDRRQLEGEDRPGPVHH